ncbi:MAG: phage tail tape measure protein, partial [Cetobacterium sp.]
MLEDFKIQGLVTLDGSGFGKQLDGLNRQASDFTGGLNKSLLKSVASFASVASAVAFLSATLKSAVADYAQLDKGIAKVNSLLQLSSEQTSAFKLELLGISEATGVWAGDLAEASYQASSAGVATANLTSFVTDATKLSQAGFTDVTTSVDVLTSVMNAYGKETYSAMQVSDMLVRTQNNGKTTVGELGKALYNVIPTAASLGVGLEQITGSIAQITMVGTPTSVAITQIATALNELGDDTKNVGLLFTQLTGTNFKQFIASGKTLADAMALLGEYSNQTKQEVKGLFGSVQAGDATTTLAKDSAEGLTKQIESMGNSAGDTAKAHKIATENIAYNWDKALNSLRASNTGMVSEYKKEIIACIAFGKELLVVFQRLVAGVFDVLRMTIALFNDDLVGLTRGFKSFVENMTSIRFDKPKKENPKVVADNSNSRAEMMKQLEEENKAKESAEKLRQQVAEAISKKTAEEKRKLEEKESKANAKNSERLA